MCVSTKAPSQSAEPEFQPKLWVSDDHHNDSCCHFALRGKAREASAAKLKVALRDVPLQMFPRYLPLVLIANTIPTAAISY